MRALMWVGVASCLVFAMGNIYCIFANPTDLFGVVNGAVAVFDLVSAGLCGWAAIT